MKTVLQKLNCPKYDGAGVSRCPKCKGTSYSGKGESLEKCTNCGSGDVVIPSGRRNGRGIVEP